MGWVKSCHGNVTMGDVGPDFKARSGEGSPSLFSVVFLLFTSLFVYLFIFVLGGGCI